MKITEQGDLDYPRLDVWGISDHDLFTAAHKIFESKNFSLINKLIEDKII